MTADDALFADYDGIEALERLAGQCVEKVLRTPYLLRDDARELLEELAYRRSQPLVETAVTFRRFTWPPELGYTERREIVADLLSVSGVASDGEFASPALRDYLAACRVVRHQQRGPAWWRTRGHLAPQAIWPWPDAGVELYLAALWWRDAQPAVERRLKRLLHERHRDPNIRFVIELIRRDLVPGGEIRDHVVELLHRELGDGQGAEGPWLATAGWLYRLDPGAAVVELENVVRIPGPSMTSRRRFAAVRELARYEPAREEKNLRILAGNLTGAPRDRLDTARLIGDRHRELGVRAMTLLANDQAMGELRVDAAIHTGSTALMRELILHDRTLSDDERLRLSAALFELDPAGAVEVLERFAGTAREVESRLRIAEMLHPHAPDAARRIATEVAWPVREEIDSWVRLRAAGLLGAFEPAQAIPLLRRLSSDASVRDEVRVRAAKMIVTDHHGTTAALIELAKDKALDVMDCADAAQAVGEIEPATGAELYLALAETRTSLDAQRVRLLRKAYALDEGQGAEALADFAKSGGAPGKLRLDAVEAVTSTLGTRRIVRLYADIVDDADSDTALAAARKAKARDLDAGQRLLGKVAGRTADSSFQIAAAQEAGGYGKHVLTAIADRNPSHTVRLAAAKALYSVDRSSGTAALWKLARRGKPGSVRIDAAFALPGSETGDALIVIAQDRAESEEVRVGAAIDALKRNRKRGREVLSQLAEEPRISPRTREKLRRLLEK